MDEALKKKLRSNYRSWLRTCSHCNGRKKEAHHKAYREGLREAVDYVNSLPLPESFKGLKVNNGFGSESDIAHWGHPRESQGVMKGDDYDGGGTTSWYWKMPSDGPAKLRWKSTPVNSLIDLIEYLEQKYGACT